MEITLQIAYLTAQGFGWNWSENQRPLDEARFSFVYTVVLLLAALIVLTGIDPLSVTIFSMVIILLGMLPVLFGLDPLTMTVLSMALTAATLPVSVVPFLFLMNDRRYVRSYRNGWLSNAVVIIIIGLAFVLAIVSIPLQIFGGS